MKFIWFFLLLVVSAGPLIPTSPRNDDFYNPPTGFENQKVGAILKLRPVPNPLTSIVNTIKVKGAWQLLVRSEDSFGNPNAIVTTIIEPFNADPKKVVSYQTFEDSGEIDCAPSYAIQYGSPINTLATKSEMYFIAAFLNQGYYVNTPDYEGPKSTFTVGKQSGQATLNSIRATLLSGNITGVDNNAKVSMIGYSGGSLASGWAASLQPAYAPELNEHLVGVALGGFVTNITATAEVCDGTIFSGIIANAMAGISNEYSNFKSFINSNINPLLTLSWNQDDKHCMFDAILYYAYKKWFSGLVRYIPIGYSIFQEDPGKSILESNGLVYQEQLVPQIPVFIYHGTIDHVVPIVNSLKTFNQWCQAGIASAEFAEDQTNGHVTETLVGAPAALTWIINRMNGIEPIKGCVHTARLNNFLYPNIIPSVLDYFKSAFDAVTLMDLGGDITKDQLSIEGLQKLQNLNV